MSRARRNIHARGFAIEQITNGGSGEILELAVLEANHGTCEALLALCGVTDDNKFDEHLSIFLELNYLFTCSGTYLERLVTNTGDDE